MLNRITMSVSYLASLTASAMRFPVVRDAEIVKIHLACPTITIFSIRDVH